MDGINVTIRRNYIYEDAYDKLSPENGRFTMKLSPNSNTFNPSLQVFTYLLT